MGRTTAGIQNRSTVTGGGEEAFSGCTDPSACNYFNGADYDDGSCYYGEDVTCAQLHADNYDGTGTAMATSVEGCQGECLYHVGCTNPDATNFDYASNYAAGMIDASYADDTLCIFEEQEIGLVYGCMNVNADNFDPNASMSETPSNCIFPSDYTESETTETKTVEESNTMYWVLGGIALIGAYMVIKKK
jgi:hypothetical protein